MSPKPRPVVVTGASRGIGRAVAQAFAQKGHPVFALARAQAELQSLAEQTHGAVTPVVTDLLDDRSLERACERVLSGPAPLVLVNNAGIAHAAPLHRTSLEDYDRQMALNARAPFLLCQRLLPAMVAAGGGRVVNVASTAALKGFKYTSAYCASKHALLGLTRALAVELASKGVTVNAVCPGWTDTSMLQRSAEAICKATGKSEAEARSTLAAMNPMGRLIRPEDVAALCLFLASDAAASITGAVYTMDGGETA